MRQRELEWKKTGWVWIVAGLLLPGLASALPITYALTSGSVTLRSTLEGGTTSLFEGDTSIGFDLDTGGVVWDAATREVSGLTFGASGPILIDLDESLVPIDSITLSGTRWQSGPGVSTQANAFGQFNLPTFLETEVSGVLPDSSPFGPVPFIADTGLATGRIVSNGDATLVRLSGVDLALFEQPTLADAPRVIVKADFTFVAEPVSAPIPEPSGALLFGLGTVLVGAVRTQALRPNRSSR
ncbi:MAG: hypothetical protein ACX98W_11365 [bacterium]